MSEEVETKKQSFSVIQKVIVALLAFILIVVMLVGVYFLAENYFFDKFFYQKSIAHGYYQFWSNKLEDWQIVAENYNDDQRNTDLLELIFAELGDQQALTNLAEKRANSNIKIALIGDSMFFGTGVRKNQTIAYFLDEILSKTYEIRVFNYSFAGDDILDNYLKYQLVKKHLDPDVVILGLVKNDLIFDNYDRYPGKQKLSQKLNKLCDKKELIEWKLDNRQDNNFDVNNLVFSPSTEKDTRNFCFLNELSVNFPQENFILLPFGCTEYLCEDDLNASYCLDAEIYSRYLSTFDKDIPMIDFCDVDVELISEKESHFAKSTNFEIAQKLAAFIIENCPIFQ